MNSLEPRLGHPSGLSGGPAANPFSQPSGDFPMIVLCGFPLSNYYNKVKLALLEKGVPFRGKVDLL